MQKRFYIPATTTTTTTGRRPSHQGGQLASWDTEGSAAAGNCGGRRGSLEEDGDVDEDEEDSHRTEVPASLFLQHVGLLHAEGGLGFKAEFQQLEGRRVVYCVPNLADFPGYRGERLLYCRACRACTGTFPVLLEEGATFPRIT